ncbi:MAG: 6-phosphofructokinase [Bacteroidetes bacterium]|nr:MAG: 6-phosphofructokinase [Bacteroidota bacterium]
MKRIALLTSGGDSPGMNAGIRAVVKYCLYYGIEPFGIYDGYQGMIDGRGKILTYDDVNNIIQFGGTILGSARCADFKTKEGRAKAISYLRSEEIEGLIVIGGDGTYTGAKILGEEMNIPIIGMPGTIDNDLFGTEYTIGFDTALNTVIDAVDKIRDTATSHHRVFFVEVMGRDAGFIALYAAIASGAESVLIPEEITDIEKLVNDIKTQNKGKRSTIIMVAEGDDGGDAFEIMNKVKPYLPEFDLRHSVLGHIQRGGSPSAVDRINATMMGAYAVDLLKEGKSHLAIGIIGKDLVTCPIVDAIKGHGQPNLSHLQLIEKLRTR